MPPRARLSREGLSADSKSSVGLSMRSKLVDPINNNAPWRALCKVHTDMNVLFFTPLTGISC